MNKESFLSIINENKIIIDQAMASYFTADRKIVSAMAYATDSGKRIRANLYLETLKMLEKVLSHDDILFAQAIEMIHAYSLVHDDLPAMDNDDMRRGKATVHKAFGEDIAILTGDALITEAARLLFEISLRDLTYMKASEYLLKTAGFESMIDGQVMDLNRSDDIDLAYIFEVYEKKTAALFMGSVVGAGLVAGASEDEIKDLKDYSYSLGLAFQIQDDLLEEDIKDELNILNVCSKDQALTYLDDINKKAKDSIENFTNNDFLMYIIDYLSERDQ